MVSKILILGATGMLGHKLAQTLGQVYETVVTTRQSSLPTLAKEILGRTSIVYNVSASDFTALKALLDTTKPDVIVNCVGIVKQLADAEDPIASITTNALLPHYLAKLAQEKGCRLITISTDCVFSGRTGNYREEDRPDPLDLYGQTKFLGELGGEHCLTLRTSMIGRQMIGRYGLVEWLVSQRNGTVKGFSNAVFSGFTTVELSKIILELIAHNSTLHGVWHVASDPINKFDLLNLINDLYELGIRITKDESVVIDRSLDGSKFKMQTGIKSRAWTDMIDQMKKDPTSYQKE